jgi:hypothetical protein
MRVREVSSQVAWSEREGNFRSAKRSAAVVVATLAALLIFLSSNIYGARQSDMQRAAQAQMAQKRADERVHAKELLGEDWKIWKAGDCDLILTRSNWAMPSGMQGTITGGLLVELRSALPLREALLRQLQIKKHYDKMDARQKLAFDKMNPPEIVESEDDSILLYVERDAAYSGRHGNSESVDSPQQAAIELADGALIMPIKTQSLEYDDKNKMLYSFLRVINGKPVLAGDDQNLKVVFGKPLTAGGHILPLQDPKKFRIAKYPDDLQLSFGAADLIYNGKLEY